MKRVALIPAAGSGARVGTDVPKQYQLAAGQPLIMHAINALRACGRIDAVYVIVNPADRYFQSHCANAPEDVVVLAVGGATRHESVLNGLDALQGALHNDDWVLVHDAARACISAALVGRLIDEVGDDPSGGLLALPVADTLKRAALDSTPVRVAQTVARNGLWQAQTPQLFPYGALRHALMHAQSEGVAVTDEASAMEALGHRPRLIEGSPSNFKVTYPEDLALVRIILEEPIS